MQPALEKAWGYQGDNMNLPVRDLAAALPYYETVLGFRVSSRSDTPHNVAVLARDGVQIGLAENGGDSTKDGCAFHVKGLEALFAEFNANGLGKTLSEFDVEVNMALMNRHLEPKLETLFVMPNEQFSYTSSTLVKQVAKFGGDVTHFVPPNVAAALKTAFAPSRS